MAYDRLEYFHPPGEPFLFASCPGIWPRREPVRLPYPNGNPHLDRLNAEGGMLS